MSTIDLILGPQHPAFKEPERFLFKTEGEIVVDVEPRLGYVHRGIEKAFEMRNYIQGLYLAERICGICNVAHTLCYAQAAEEVYGVEVPPRARYLRAVIHELNRIHSHLLIIGVAAELIGFDTLFMLIWRDREIVMDLVEMMTGNRVISAYITIGGVRRDVSPEFIEKAKKMLTKLEERVKYYRKVWIEDPIIRARCVEVGKLSKADAIKLCAVGPTARGSGVNYDVRRHRPYAAYDEIPFNVVLREEGDVWARVLCRIDETLEAINIVKYALDHLPSGDIRVKVPIRPPPGEGVAFVEAPRGELLHHVYSDGTDKPYRWRVRTPTYANIPAVCHMFKGCYIADIPAILVSIDPCFSCTDRVTILDIRTNERKILTWTQLKKMFREFRRPKA
ncbi:MAG: NADH dehydrogenase subunit [Thermoprotei archaeon]|nr:MAG: NADH dehydrogenase subunit [Thermoprotei archaeon]RLE56833.1 MAG: NADH dehydrogenase subunit [Thermoprotei archaeon]